MNILLHVTIGSILSALFSALAIVILIPAAEKFQLVDKPDSNRKRHLKPTPLIGGIGILIGAGFALLLSGGFPDAGVLFLILSGVAFLGLLDDYMDLSLIHI